MSAPHTWPNTLPGNSNLHTGGVRTPALAQCDHMVVIRAEGEEAGQYLQGQLTCDLAGIDNGQHHTALHLSLKGRGLASLRLARAGDGYVLVSPAAQAQAAIQCLEKYRLRAKITFQVDPRLHVHQLAGRIEAALASAGLPVPAPGQVATATNGTMIWRYPHTDHALLIGHTDSTAQWQALAAGRTVTDGSGARFQDVLAGEAQLYPGAQDLFLPQMLNFDVLGGVSFKKGCYTGQEVVARMHFKGRLKQRMQAFEHDGEPLKPGETVRDGKGRAVGDVVDGAAGEPRPVALVVVRLDHDGELYHQERPLRAQRLPLPYALPKPKTA